MKTDPQSIEQAVKRARYELTQEAGEPMAAVVEKIFFNTLSDAAVRAESAGFAEEDSFAFFLRFCRRVCELYEVREE